MGKGEREPVTKERNRAIYDYDEGVEEIKKFNFRETMKTDGISLAILFLLYVLQVRPLSKIFFLRFWGSDFF